MKINIHYRRYSEDGRNTIRNQKLSTGEMNNSHTIQNITERENHHKNSNSNPNPTYNNINSQSIIEHTLNKEPEIEQKRWDRVGMTLGEYLESVNLKRRISSRSKDKKNGLEQKEFSTEFDNIESKTPNHNSNKNANNNLLKPPQHHQNSHHNNLSPSHQPTSEYHKLNKEWKSRKLFSTWIQELKELCREYIKPDEEYIEVVRLVEKIAEFVRSEIESIRRDNLLLESFLVTEASYWGGDGNSRFLLTNRSNTNCSGEKITTSEVVLNINEGEMIMTQNNLPLKMASGDNILVSFGEENSQNMKMQSKHTTVGEQSLEKGNKQAVEDEGQNHKQHLHKESAHYYSTHENKHIKKFGSHGQSQSSAATESKNKPYLFSFNDKDNSNNNNESTRVIEGTNNNGNQINEVSEKHYRQQPLRSPPVINPFIVEDSEEKKMKMERNNLSKEIIVDGDKKRQELLINHQDELYELGLLRIHSRNDDNKNNIEGDTEVNEVPRLSLMSRYGQEGRQKLEHEQEKTSNFRSSNCRRVQDNLEKPPLRERKQKQQQQIPNNDLLRLEDQQSSKHLQVESFENKIDNNSKQYFVRVDGRVPPLNSKKNDAIKIEEKWLYSDNEVEPNFGYVENSNQPSINHEYRTRVQSAERNNNSKIAFYRSKEHEQQQEEITNSKRLYSSFVESSPSVVKKSPQTIQIETPSTLKRRYPLCDDNNKYGINGYKLNNSTIKYNSYHQDSY